MEFVFKDLKAGPGWAWLPLVLAGIIVVAVAFSPNVSSFGQGMAAIAAYLGVVLFLWPCLLKAAHEDHKHLLTVVIWSFALVILGIATSFFAFFKLAGTDYAKYDKLLNVVPVFVAIWAAAVGWLIHFKLTTKAHRTNNAFAIIMETRKSAEFLKRSEIVHRHFPPGTLTIPQEYHRFFDPQVIRDLHKDQAAGTDVSEDDLARAEAILALKYILNYYEFMAVGIRAGDLDESLVFDTISAHVVNLFARASALVDYTVNPNHHGGHPKTYCDLRALVPTWKTKMALLAHTAG